MLRISAFETPEGTGWDLSTGLATQPEDEEAYLGEKMVERDGVRRCLSCHTTSVHAVLKDAGPEAADHSIGCEACHGPGGHHEAAVTAGFSDSAIAGTRASSAAEINQTCGRCHGFPRWEKLALSRTDPALYRFQALGMSWSRCYAESDGILSCVTCHDPHRNVQTSVAINEGKCLSCHADRDGKALTTSGPKRPSEPDTKPALSRRQSIQSDEDDLPRESDQGLSRMPHAASLAEGKPLLQDGSLHPGPRTGRSREFIADQSVEVGSEMGPDSGPNRRITVRPRDEIGRPGRYRRVDREDRLRNGFDESWRWSEDRPRPHDAGAPASVRIRGDRLVAVT